MISNQDQSAHQTYIWIRRDAKVALDLFDLNMTSHSPSQSMSGFGAWRGRTDKKAVNMERNLAQDPSDGNHDPHRCRWKPTGCQWMSLEDSSACRG